MQLRRKKMTDCEATEEKKTEGEYVVVCKERKTTELLLIISGKK